MDERQTPAYIPALTGALLKMLKPSDVLPEMGMGAGPPHELLGVNPILSGRLRDLDSHGWTRPAFVPGAIDRPHRIPVTVAALYAGVSVGRCQQEISC
jgi:hypothetical protein